ncbi:MAG: hypothetical protein AB7T49_17615 [Oligoflexales bacterium]
MKMLKCVLPILLFVRPGLCFAKSVTVQLDAPESIVMYHSDHVSLYLSYEDGDITFQHGFSREELREGTLSKVVQLREDSEVVDCSFKWDITEDPRMPIEPNLPLLISKKDSSKPVEGHCIWSEDRSIIKIATSLKFDVVTISATADSLKNKKARFFYGTLTYPGMESRYTFDSNAGVPAEWRVNVVAPSRIARGVVVKWFPNEGNPLVQKFDAAGPDIIIDGLD